MAQQTPKEKAIELLDKMSSQTYQYQEYAGARYTTSKVGYEAGKKCALIAVNEIIPIVNSYENALSASQQSDYLEYWYEVKQEIEKL